MLTADREAWDRQPGETPRAWAAFSAYRDSGKTRQVKGTLIAVDGNAKRLTSWWLWVKKHSWYERVRLYDQEMDRAAIEARKLAIAEMEMRHASTAKAMGEKVALRVELLKPEEIAPGVLVQWFAESAKIERVARGQPSDHIQQTGTQSSVSIDLSKLTDEELAFLDGIAKRLAKSGSAEPGSGTATQE